MCGFCEVSLQTKLNGVLTGKSKPKCQRSHKILPICLVQHNIMKHINNFLKQCPKQVRPFLVKLRACESNPMTFWAKQQSKTKCENCLTFFHQTLYINLLIKTATPPMNKQLGTKYWFHFKVFYNCTCIILKLLLRQIVYCNVQYNQPSNKMNTATTLK